MDNVFQQWFQIKTTEKMLLIMDNGGPNSVPGFKGDSQIEIINLPPNTTSVYQPMDMGAHNVMNVFAIA
jgi:hypothetical protein